MSKRKKILQFLFLLIIIIEKVSSEEFSNIIDTSSSKNDMNNIIDTSSSTTDMNNIIDTSSSKNDMNNIIDPSSSTTDMNNIIDSSISTTDIKFDNTETPEVKSKRLCGETQPLKGIKEECYQEKIISSNNEVCCYLTIKYETSEHFECIAINKNLAEIKNKINEYKKNYEGSKSISIDCNSPLIRITLISFLLFLIF